MIAYLKGELLAVEKGKLIVNCGGIGYLVNVSDKGLQTMMPGEVVEVFTFTYVKEDVLALYGFKDRSTLQLFERLISVSGVGPKIGMSIMSVGNSDAIVLAIKNGDVEFFTKVPGIGKKNAQRIIVELRNKVGGDMDDLSYLSEEDNQVVEALMSLGFAKKEISDVVKQVDKSLSIEEQIKWSLKQLSR